MTLTFYNQTSDSKCCNKQLNTALGTALTLAPTKDVSLLSPVFTVDYNATWLTANYCYCDTFGRFYYIKDIKISTAGRMLIYCEIDVRQTYYYDMLNCSATIIKCELIKQPSIYPDNQLPVNPTSKQITSIVLDYDTESPLFDVNAEYSYLLTVIGGQTE